MDPKRNTDLEFSYGSGHINPAAELDPGLVFNASEADYVNFLCKQGYNTSMIRLICGDDNACKKPTTRRAWDLIYLSFSVYEDDKQQIEGSFVRTVTNVGAADSTYTASISMPPLTSVKVEPSVLTFSSIGETISYTVNATGAAIEQQRILSGAITWNDGNSTTSLELLSTLIKIN